VTAGSFTSSYQAELVAIRAALERGRLLEGSVALQVLQSGPSEQSTLTTKPTDLRGSNQWPMGALL
jgi:hypothetical protein